METKLKKPHVAKDPQGLIVSLDQGVWERIVGVKGHVELRTRLEDVLQAIKTPNLIQESTIDSNSRVYYWLKPTTLGKYSKLYVVVIVRVDADSVTGHIRTAYLTAKVGKGRLLWAGKK